MVVWRIDTLYRSRPFEPGDSGAARTVMAGTWLQAWPVRVDLLD